MRQERAERAECGREADMRQKGLNVAGEADMRQKGLNELVGCGKKEGKMELERYNVVWGSQSRNSGESMPCGGYDIGANVWVEENELYLYIDRSGYFDENNQMLKTGRYHFRFKKNPFGKTFRQELKLEQGCVEIAGEDCRIEIRMDTESPLCAVHMGFKEPIEVTAVYENWRDRPYLVPSEERHSLASYMGYPDPIYTWPDEVHPDGNKIVFFHKNRNDRLLFDRLIKEQNLDNVKENFYNPQKDFIFGGVLSGDKCRYDGTEESVYAMIPCTGYRLLAERSKIQQFWISFHSCCTADEQIYLDGIQKCMDNRPRWDVLCERAEDWWKRYWEKSHVFINPQKDEKDTGFQISRNYTLFRYMMGCNARGNYPTKFNGGLFITDACWSVSEEHRGKTPDFRMWGGGSFTGQNQRLLYWGLLASGDFDLMPQQFDFYNRLLLNARLRTQEYWGHDGCSFTEQLEDIGLPILWNWGFKETKDPYHQRPVHYDRTELRGPWIKYEYSTQLEFSYMILEYYRYSGRDIGSYIPLIESCVRFYFEHYKKTNYENANSVYDENGKLVIFPSTALETYKNACNPMDAVAGLRAVVGRLMELPQYVDTHYYEELYTHIPSLPKEMAEGEEILAPAEFWKGKINCERPQMYPVFPYHFYGVGRPELGLAVRTWKSVPEDSEQKNYVSWHQDGIFTARMGLTKEAERLLALKLQDSGRRFPAFWGPGHDWVPDHNWGGSGMIALQEMLVQEARGIIYLFPAWPSQWDVEFRLHLPQNRVITGKNINYKIERMILTQAGESCTECRECPVVNCLEEKGEHYGIF